MSENDSFVAGFRLISECAPYGASVLRIQRKGHGQQSGFNDQLHGKGSVRKLDLVYLDGSGDCGIGSAHRLARFAIPPIRKA